MFIWILVALVGFGIVYYFITKDSGYTIPGTLTSAGPLFGPGY